MSDMEVVVKTALLKHRRLVASAEERHDIWASATQDDGQSTETAFLRNNYISAMIDVHAHQAALSTLIEILGYVPETQDR